jgi:hypothetical protein
MAVVILGKAAERSEGKNAERLFAAQFFDPVGDSFSAGAYAWISDSAIFRELALGPNRADADAGLAILQFQVFEDKLIAGADSEDTANLTRDRDLALAGDFGLFLYFLTLTQTPYFRKGCGVLRGR